MCAGGERDEVNGQRPAREVQESAAWPVGGWGLPERCPRNASRGCWKGDPSNAHGQVVSDRALRLESTKTVRCSARRRHAGSAQFAGTHLVPSKQRPSPHEQVRTVALLVGAQLHAPGRHVLGNSVTPAQQRAEETVPPVSVHPEAASDAASAHAASAQGAASEDASAAPSRTGAASPDAPSAAVASGPASFGEDASERLEPRPAFAPDEVEPLERWITMAAPPRRAPRPAWASRARPRRSRGTARARA
jgi:hypothetical protein